MKVILEIRQPALTAKHNRPLLNALVELGVGFEDAFNQLGLSDNPKEVKIECVPSGCGGEPVGRSSVIALHLGHADYSHRAECMVGVDFVGGKVSIRSFEITSNVEYTSIEDLSEKLPRAVAKHLCDAVAQETAAV